METSCGVSKSSERNKPAGFTTLDSPHRDKQGGENAYAYGGTNQTWESSEILTQNPFEHDSHHPSPLFQALASHFAEPSGKKESLLDRFS